jgi:DNA-binding beta-propeller fold protein YncE
MNLLKTLGLCCCCILLQLPALCQTLAQIESQRITLHNGWGITPIGKSAELGDFPLNMAVSPNGKYVVVSNDGQSSESLQLLDAKKLLVLDNKIVAKLWVGLTWSADSHTVYASGGNDNIIYRFDVKNNQLLIHDSIILGKPWPEKISVSGLALDDGKKILYAVTKEDNSIYIIDAVSKLAVHRIALPGKAYACLLSPDKKHLYVSCWSCNKVIDFNCETQQIDFAFSAGEHPNDLCLNKAGTVLYAANANDNTVSVIDLQKRSVIEVLETSLFANSPTGATSNSVALSDDEKTLYIANAQGNYLAVFDVSVAGNSKSLGFIPTGWFPSCVRTLGKEILVLNARGFSSHANPRGPNPAVKEQKVNYQMGDLQKPEGVQYIGGLFKGTLSEITEPGKEQMDIYTKVVYHNSPLDSSASSDAHGMKGNPIPRRVGSPSPIKYVFYIIKENRTYDQVLGDMKEGNGDPALVLFGENITPNQHALARNFVLLDNFYVNGAVSADGHDWSTSAYASDYMEKSWPTWYGGRGGDGDPDDERRMLTGKGGFIWDACKKYGISYRTYGEFTSNRKARVPGLQDHVCKDYTPWNLNVMDTMRYAGWAHDFDSLLALDQVPQLNIFSVPNDHTSGLSMGKPTPFACVADNDLAVGLFVEHLSQSRIWNESVVFILEDDAQNGPDHVDAHRSPGYLAGGWVKRGITDHTQYTTCSMLRTIELILGLPPMTQFDAAAEPMWRCFDTVPHSEGFKAIGAKVDLFEKNTVMNEWQRKSEQLDFSAPDLAPEALLNEIIWNAVKGEKQSLPPARHSAFLTASRNKTDD